jgi:hypothetical protein
VKQYVCDDCGGTLTKECTNTVTVKNVFNHEHKLHYCAACAIKIWPRLQSMLSWTRRP